MCSGDCTVEGHAGWLPSPVRFFVPWWSTSATSGWNPAQDRSGNDPGHTGTSMYVFNYRGCPSWNCPWNRASNWAWGRGPSKKEFGAPMNSGIQGDPPVLTVTSATSSTHGRGQQLIRQPPYVPSDWQHYSGNTWNRLPSKYYTSSTSVDLSDHTRAGISKLMHRCVL